MITDADIKKMKEVFATKEDLKSFDKRFNKIDKRFNEIDKRFEGIDKRFEGIDKRFDGIDKRFDGIDNKIDSLSKTIHKSNEDLVELITNGFNDYEKRTSRLEARVFGTN